MVASHPSHIALLAKAYIFKRDLQEIPVRKLLPSVKMIKKKWLTLLWLIDCSIITDNTLYGSTFEFFTDILFNSIGVKREKDQLIS